MDQRKGFDSLTYRLEARCAQSIRLGVTEVIRLDEDIVLKTTGLKRLLGSSPRTSALPHSTTG